MGPPLQAASLALVRRHLPNESQHLFALTLAVGVVCGLLAVAFHLAIQAAEHLLIERALHAQGSAWMFWTVLSPTLGGLLAGAALTRHRTAADRQPVSVWGCEKRRKCRA